MFDDIKTRLKKKYDPRVRNLIDLLYFSLIFKIENRNEIVANETNHFREEIGLIVINLKPRIRSIPSKNWGDKQK